MNAQTIHDQEAEQTVIGAVLINPSCLVDVGPLEPGEFYDPRHQAIWAAVKSLDLDQEPIDQITVSDRMAQAGTFETLRGCGGRAYFVELAGNVVTFENIGYHVGRLKRIARRREVSRWASRLAVDAGDQGIDAEDFLDTFERGALQLTARDEQTGGPRPMSVIVREVVNELEQRSENRSEGGVTGIPTGIRGYDSMTLGLQPGDLILLAARPSMGKTALALNWIANAVAEADEPAIFFSLEMKDKPQVERMLAKNARVSSQTLRRGRLDRDEWIAVTAAASRMSTWGLEIDERPSPDLATIRTTTRTWRARLPKKHQNKIGLVVVDYIGLMAAAAGSHRWEPNRARELGEIARGLKHLARELGVALVCLSQLNRSLESRADKRPIMSDLKESGALEEHADTIAFIYREFVYSKKAEDEDLVEIIIGKQRNGPSGIIEDVRWDGKLQSFTNAPRKDDYAAPRPASTIKAPYHPYAPGEDSE